MRPIRIAIIVAALAGALTATGLAQAGGPHHRGHGAHHDHGTHAGHGPQGHPHGGTDRRHGHDHSQKHHGHHHDRHDAGDAGECPPFGHLVRGWAKEQRGRGHRGGPGHLRDLLKDCDEAPEEPEEPEEPDDPDEGDDEEPTGRATFSGETAGARFAATNAGPELLAGIVPFGAGQANTADYAWEDGTYRVAAGFLAFGFFSADIDGPDPGTSPDTTLLQGLQPTCGAWDTLEIAIERGEGTTAELRNVVLDGVALGDFVDNGDGVSANDYWTITGLALDAGFELTADLVVAGWGGDTAPPASVQFTVGCGAA